jgi:hypothetical protein
MPSRTLSAPVSSGGRRWATTRRALRNLRTALKGEYDGQIGGDAEFGEWLRAAKTQGFGNRLLERLDNAINVAEGPTWQNTSAAPSKRAGDDEPLRTGQDSNGFTSTANRLSDRLEVSAPPRGRAPSRGRDP